MVKFLAVGRLFLGSSREVFEARRQLQTAWSNVIVESLQNLHKTSTAYHQVSRVTGGGRGAVGAGAPPGREIKIILGLI